MRTILATNKARGSVLKSKKQLSRFKSDKTNAEGGKRGCSTGILVAKRQPTRKALAAFGRTKHPTCACSRLRKLSFVNTLFPRQMDTR